MIETMDLTKRFGSLTAVDSVNIKVEQGEIFGLLGPVVCRIFCKLDSPVIPHIINPYP